MGLKMPICAAGRIHALESAGVTVVKSPAQMGTAMAKIMNDS
jgi:succinyl-CoA synthetase alpha subunit